jgi:hypothetical protein
LKNFDARRGEIEELFKPVYGDGTTLWMRRWRWFFLATAGLFGHAGGNEWGASHDRLRPSWLTQKATLAAHSRSFGKSAWPARRLRGLLFAVRFI